MNMNDLKSAEPFFGKWFIKEDIGTKSSDSLYLIYCIENGVCEYCTMKIIGVPKDKHELRQLQFQELDYDSSVQYYKELVTDLYRDICLLEEMKDRSHLVSYQEHMIFQRGNGVGYDIFLRMEHLPNITEVLQLSDLKLHDILQLGKEICDALSICELYHITHGNLRPETIFVTENDSFKLGDFPISRYAKQEEVLYEPKEISDYMAPEIYQGKVYDNRADIYSLGLVMYQLLNDNKLPPKNSVLPKPVHATEELSKVIAKACDLNPKQRYQSAEEFKDALTSIAVFLDSDINFLEKDYTVIPEDIYIINEVVPSSRMSEPVEDLHQQLDVTIQELERKIKRKQEKVKEENGKNLRPWVATFLLLVFTASVLALLSQVDFTKQVGSSSVEASSNNPTPIMAPSPTSIVAPTKEPTQQPTSNPVDDPTVQPTLVPDIDPPVIDEADLITIIKSGKKLTSLEGITGLDKAIAIDLSNNKLIDIDGLKEAVYAKTLVLSHNRIVNVEALHALTNLTALDISNNQITSFIKLRNLEQLEILSASNNMITSLEGLEKLTSLKILYLNGNSIQDISILKELTSLEMIDLSKNKVKDKDIKALKKALPDCIIIN
jgi:serine/threonine protein kinase